MYLNLYSFRGWLVVSLNGDTPKGMYPKESVHETCLPNQRFGLGLQQAQRDSPLTVKKCPQQTFTACVPIKFQIPIKLIP